MSHATCTQGNRVNFWLLMVRNQIANLTLGLLFGHNLCYKCPNGSCEPILNIYISIDFQWYKEIFNPMGLSRFGSSLGFQLPKWKLPWECEGSFPHTFLHSWDSSWPTTLQTLALVANPRLRLRHGRWCLPPSLHHVESCDFVYGHGSSMCVRGSFVHQKCSNYVVTNLLFGLSKSIWIIDTLVTRLCPHFEAPACPSYPKSVAN
jgi:hypothetical protein